MCIYFIIQVRRCRDKTDFKKEQDVYQNVLRFISPQIKVKQLILSYRSILPKAVFIKRGGTYPKCTIYAYPQRAKTKQASGSEKK